MRSLLVAFLRASSLHISGAAATASLRHDLVGGDRLRAPDLDGAFAVSRITPGTNQLAFYALLGHKLGGWPLALSAVAIGVGVPAAIVMAIVFFYAHSTSGIVVRIMAGGRAAGVGVFLGSAVRLLQPYAIERPAMVTTICLVAAILTVTQTVSLFVVLGVAAMAGAWALRPR